MVGIMLDLHGTLLDSNNAWIKAFQKYDSSNICYYQQAVWNKVSRKEMAKVAGISLEDVREEYNYYLHPREEVLSLVKVLSNTYEMVIVSNACEEDVIRDLRCLSGLNYKAVFTKEDGIKPDKMYLHNILDRLGWEFAYFIGNDEYEDLVMTERICSILVPYSPNYFR